MQRRPGSPTSVVAGAVLAMVLAVAGALGGCSSSGSSDAKVADATVVAHVGSAQVTFGQVKGYLDAAVEAARDEPGGYATGSALKSPVAGAGPAATGGYTRAAWNAALTDRIRYVLYDQEMRARGVKLASRDQVAAHRVICVDPKTGVVPADTRCPALQGWSDVYRVFLTDLRARTSRFEQLAGAQAYAALQSSAPEALTQVCVQLVRVADQVVVDQVIHNMAGGQTMAQAAASAVKVGRAATPQEGCLFPSDLPDQVVAAAPGVTLAVNNSDGIFVAHVVSHQTATVDDFAAAPPVAEPAVKAAIARAESALLAKDKVAVLPGYGRWDPATQSVRSP